MPNSPSWSRPPAPQRLDARELVRRQAVRRPAGPQPGDDPLGPAPRLGVDDGFDDAVDDALDGDGDLDEPGASPGARHRAGLAPWREEVRQRAADRVPPGVRALRWRVGRSAARGAAVVAVLVLLALLVAAYLSWPRQDAASDVAAGRPVPPRTGAVAVTSPAGGALAVPSSAGARSTPAAAPDDAAASTSSPTASVVVVHVAGQVLRPGLVTLPAGSRVAQALAAAGGARETADLDRVNLARPLVDGEQVLVPAPGEAVPAAAGAPAASAAATAGPLDLNAATADDLDGLPGVGEVLAGRVLAWRTEHGRFSDVEELGEVQGIGPKLLDGLRLLVRV